MTTQVWEERAVYDLPARIAVASVDRALLAIGRVIFGGFFFFSGLHHFVDLGALARYAGAAGVPDPRLAVAGSGALILAGGFGVLTGLWPRVGSAMIIVFLLGVTPVTHAFWRDPQGALRAGDIAQFTKNIGLLGGACVTGAISERTRRAFLARPTPGAGAEDQSLR